MMDRNTIAISGASGFIGSYLSNYFINLGYRVLPLSRQLFKASAQKELELELSKAIIVVNLAGAPINKLWTKSYKEELYDSRISVTKKIVNAINNLEVKPKLLISASAIGYYKGNKQNSEFNAEKGNGFLAQLCEAWESEAQLVDKSVRLVLTRFAVVLASNGGALEKMLLPTKFKIASVLGSKEQLFSWIDIEDLAAAYNFIIHNSSLDGVLNLSAPYSVKNKQMLDLIGKYWGSWIKFRIPSWVVRFVLGESSEFIIQSLDIVPQKLLDAGFQFQSPCFEDFCRRIKA